MIVNAVTICAGKIMDTNVDQLMPYLHLKHGVHEASVSEVVEANCSWWTPLLTAARNHWGEKQKEREVNQVEKRRL